jgi:hypothetical protein
MRPLWPRFYQKMLDWAKTLHEAIGIQSPKLFILVFAVGGFLIFGFVGWMIDKGYRVKMEQDKPKTEQAAIIPPASASPATHAIATPSPTPFPQTKSHHKDPAISNFPHLGSPSRHS